MVNTKKLTFLFWMILISSCVEKHDIVFNRAQQPWAVRSVLDYQPRMLTLALDSSMYAAYNLETCRLYKAWKGGVNWDGIVFTHTKVIQPTTWGNHYLLDPQTTDGWWIESNGQKVETEVQFNGYEFRDGHIFLSYSLSTAEDTVQITERPEYIEGTDGRPGLERVFIRSGGGDVITYLHTQAETWEIVPGESTFRTLFEVLPSPVKPTATVRTDSRGRYWLEKSDCFTCHEWSENTVGPGFEQIANQYPENKEVIQNLVQRIKNGGSGVWGTAIMNPHPDISDDDLGEMVRFILSLDGNDDSQKQASSKPKTTSKEVLPKKPGFGAPLSGVHPSFEVANLEPPGHEFTVGGLAFLPDGRLMVATWSPEGSVYLIDGVETADSSELQVKKIAQGLMEPLGAAVVDGSLYVMQKHELTQLIDLDGDEVIDQYKAVCNSFAVSTDFHEFAMGLVYRNGHFYANLSIPMRLMSNEKPLPDRGRTIKIALDGTFEHINHGLRQPNGIGLGINDQLFVTDNQGQWLPGNKFIHVQKGAFHGMRWVLEDSDKDIEETPPAVWLPQDEIANSPSEPTTINLGPYQNQMLYGDVSHGGIKRVYLEEVNGAYQGVVFRFTQGLQAGVNRLSWGPDGALYVGEAGMVGGWSWKGKRHGLQRLSYRNEPAFEMLTVKALTNGFRIEFTEPLAAGHGESAQDYLVQQWWYQPTASYGGPKMDLEQLSVKTVTVSNDRKSVDLELPGLKEGRVVYFLLSDKIESSGRRALWSGEGWYTLNHIPKTML